MAKKKRIKDDDFLEKQKKFENIADNLEIVPADRFLKENFLPYAWSYNLDRALTDVTGLKPVQRRILYTMFRNGLKPTANRGKVAKLAGNVLEYHPHGDASIAEALKNIARPHIFRVPLIDGKGDFGSPGTPGAAGRYIEARLNRAAWINVEEISENAVRMIPSYDNKGEEPLHIPVKWPVSIINGGSGIAVAFSANMPSHNPTEIMEACRKLLVDPELSVTKLQKIILGPDFNMGGTITAIDGVKDYLETGSGTFKIRANYEVTPKPRGVHRIEFYEIPFGTSPEKIIEDIQKAIDKDKLKDVDVFKDLSDLKHPIRVIVETKPKANYKKVLQELFKVTSLETNFAANITTIVDNRPVQSPMRDLLLNFIDFRKSCVKNKSKFKLGKLSDRLHLVEGLLLTLLDIDKAIKIIRGSDNSDIANEELQKAFKLDKTQADHVLSLQLRRLTKMDKVELDNEKITIEETIAKLKELLENEEVMVQYLDNEFKETIKVIGDERKTDIVNMTSEEVAEAQKLALKEAREAEKNNPCYVTRFANGTLLKTHEEFAYPNDNNYGPIVEQIKMKTQENIVIVGNMGDAVLIPLSYLIFDHLSELDSIGIDLGNSTKIVALGKETLSKNDTGILIGTKLGEVKIVKPQYPNKETFTVYNLSEGDEIVNGYWLGRALTNRHIVSVTKDNFVLMYEISPIRPSGANAGGVRGHKLKDGDHVISFNIVPSKSDVNSFVVSQTNMTIKLTPISDIAPKGRGSQGMALHRFKKGETHLVNSYAGNGIIINLDKSFKSINMPPATKRAGSGVDFALPVIFGLSQVEVM